VLKLLGTGALNFGVAGGDEVMVACPGCAARLRRDLVPEVSVSVVR